MDHFSELTYLMYADTELPEPERLRVQQHLAECDLCRRQVAALEAENRLLVEVFQSFQDAPGTVTAARGIARSLLLTVVSALCVAVGLDQALLGLERLAPGWGSWLNSFSLTWLQDFFFNNAFDLVREGPAMLNALVTVLGFVVLGAIVVGVLRYFLVRHPMSLAVVSTALLVLCLPRPASAIETRKGSDIRVAPTETVDQTLAATGGTISIEGTVNGNLIASGDRLVIRGTVDGDVFWAGHELEVPGTVEGSIYTWSGSVVISGHVERSIYVWSGAVELNSTARIDDDILAAAGNVRTAGIVGRDISVACSTLDVSGTVGRNIQAATNLLTVESSAHVGGFIDAHVDRKDEVEIEPGSSVAGKTDITLKKAVNHYTKSKFYFWQAIWLAGALLLGLLLNWVAPTLVGARLDTGGALLRAAGLGFLALVATPVAVIIACVTLVGIPAGVAVFLLYLIAIWAAKIFVGAAVGRSLVHGRGGKAPVFALALLVGLVLVSIAINLPYHVGGWLTFLVILIGLGLLVTAVHQSMKRGTPALEKAHVMS